MSGSQRPPDDLEERWPVEWDEAAPEPSDDPAGVAGSPPPPPPEPVEAPAPLPRRPASTWLGSDEADAGLAPEEPPVPRPPLLYRLAGAGFLIPAVIFAVAVVTRLARLGTPDEVIPLDETHYVADAKDVVRFGSEDHFVVHPPLGKWFIAAGMRIFGRESAFGWRFFGALLGAAGVVVIYLIALRLWRSRRTAILAALLLGVEGLWFVQSRVAMLDIYAGFFVLLAFWLLLEDRERADRDGIRWWRIAAGVATGAALASKWGAAPVVALVAGLGLVWEWRRLRGRDGFRRSMLAQSARMAGVFLLLPAILYLLTYVPWFARSDRYEPPACRNRNLMSSWVCYQDQILNFHQGLKEFDDKGKVKHPYFSDAWSWAYAGRPVAHYYRTDGSGDEQRDREVLGLPNPAVWWAGFLAIVPLGVWAAFRRDSVAATILFGIGLFWAPYLLFGAFGRPNFLFYATPLAPFLVLGVVHLLHRLWAQPGGGALVFAYVLIAVMMFLYFYPVLAAVSIPHDGTFGWRARIWFSGDCTAEGIKSLCWI